MNAEQLAAALQLAQSLAILIMQAGNQLSVVSSTILAAQKDGRAFTAEEWAKIGAPSSQAITDLANTIQKIKDQQALQKKG